MKKAWVSALRKHLLYGTIDIVLTFAVVLISFVSLYGYKGFVDHILYVSVYGAGLALLTFAVLAIGKSYRIITTQSGIMDAIRIMVGVIIANIIGYFVVALVPQFGIGWNYIWVWALTAISLCFMIPAVRLFVRAGFHLMVILKKQNSVRTLVIGAGATGKVVIDETRRNKDNRNKVVAIVDDDPNKIGGSLAGIPIKGPISDVAKIIDYTKANEVIIAMSKITEERLHEVIQLLNPCNVRVRRMPLLSEMEGPNDKRIIDVDLDDLLSRDPVVLDNSKVTDMLHGKCVLVTGAGGSIGSELVRQIFKTHPATLILFDIYENSTYDIQMELVSKIREEKIKDIKLVTLIGSTYNETRVEQIIRRYKPDYIYHAAAYKHVPLMEDSPAEAIRTNVVGTYNVAKTADKYGVKKMVLVSTDKAVRPTNVMGATKRFAETIIQYYAEHSRGTKYAAVRFGNVLGSNGSVVPLFKKQIEAGGPVTITDKEIIRYFMTIPEAVSLILQCGLFAEGGEIFILDMGKPVKILDLAEKLIRQAGLVPYVDINIVETGLRPGEKLYEELLINVDRQIKTENKKIFIEPRESVNEQIESDVLEASKAFNLEETKDIKQLLTKLITTYEIKKGEN